MIIMHNQPLCKARFSPDSHRQVTRAIISFLLQAPKSRSVNQEMMPYADMLLLCVYLLSFFDSQIKQGIE